MKKNILYSDACIETPIGKLAWLAVNVQGADRKLAQNAQQWYGDPGAKDPPGPEEPQHPLINPRYWTGGELDRLQQLFGLGIPDLP